MYQTIQCQSLDMLAVTLKNRNALRVFYVYSPNDFMDVEYSNPRSQILWIAKIARNSHSDGSGHFALEQPYSNQIHIYDFKHKRKIDTIYIQKIKDLCFCSCHNLVFLNIDETWI